MKKIKEGLHPILNLWFVQYEDRSILMGDGVKYTYEEVRRLNGKVTLELHTLKKIFKGEIRCV